MEKIQFWRLFTTSHFEVLPRELLRADRFKFRAWNYPVLMANGDADDTPLQIHARTCNPSDFFALHPLSWLLLDAFVSTEWSILDSWLRYWSLKLLSLPDCNREQTPLTGESRRDWYQIIKAISYHQHCVPTQHCVSLSTTENRDSFGPLEEHFSHLSSITLLNHQRALQEIQQWSGTLLE